MSIDLTHPEVQFAVETVRQASLLVRDVERELVNHAITKSDKSPVTVADFAAQALVGCLLERAFPGDPLVAEEDSAHLREPEASETLRKVAHFVGRYMAYATPETVCAWIDHGGSEPDRRFWTLDPIDGTKGFLRGDQYAVALALIVDGTVQLGVLGCPNLVDGRTPERAGSGSLVIARRGDGAWTIPLTENGAAPKQLHVSEIFSSEEARVLRSVDAGHTNVGRVAQLMETLGVRAEPVLMDSQAKYAVMAAGDGDLLYRLLTKAQPDYREKIWDHAAGSLIIEEAGGRVSDLTGQPLDFTQGRSLVNNVGIVATNGHLHDTALAAIRTVFQDLAV
ncbi:MAG: 3'(2'),5'-bisphosphate nucleotidase [Candidatus Hydrogenedentes bacterium]|nr:3'(2'),5'-bisphosphate nucleotidase [Candidatus Hydrogenedentota bacterium]